MRQLHGVVSRRHYHGEKKLRQFLSVQVRESCSFWVSAPHAYGNGPRDWDQSLECGGVPPSGASGPDAVAGVRVAVVVCPVAQSVSIYFLTFGVGVPST